MVAVREARPNDRAAIDALVREAFGGHDEALLVRRLGHAGDVALELVADDAGELIGHVMLSRMTAPFTALALAPLAVVPQRQRTGIGSALTREAIAWARGKAIDALVVLGDANYYSRFGFSAAAAAPYASPYAGPHLMLLALQPGLPAGGALHYAPAFSTLG